jgi:Na+-translocating ferredoxin:NAD+ oxidoreductase RnfC subunit
MTPNTSSFASASPALSLERPSLDRIEELGIVGAGGGGFPTAVKFRAQSPS